MTSCVCELEEHTDGIGLGFVLQALPADASPRSQEFTVDPGCGTCNRQVVGRLQAYSTVLIALSLQHHRFALPFSMVKSRSKPHHAIRCEPCNCSLTPGSLQQHESGRQHLQNVASSGSRPSAPSQTASTIRPALSNISPPAGSNTSTPDTDPRVHVSGEDGLDFFVEGSGAPTNPYFPATTHRIWIEKTNTSSSLSLRAVTLTPFGSWCD